MTHAYTTVRRRKRRTLYAAMVFLGLIVHGCTVFDGLTVPPKTVLSAGYLSLEEGVRACRFVHDCPMISAAIARSAGVPAIVNSFSACLSWFVGPLPSNRFGLNVQRALLQCVVQANDCSEALACAYVEPMSEGDPRCAGAVGDQCSMDGTLLDCTTEIAARCHTPYYGAGSECQLGLAGTGRCALSACALATSPPPRCTSGVYVRCDPATNLRVAQDCNTVGLTCPEGAEGADAQCATEDGVFPCDEPGRTTCSPDKTRVRVCDGALASEFDCSAMRATCLATTSGEARCIRSTDTCAPEATDIDVCQGNTISLCVSGERIKFDCGDVGLLCIPSSDTERARCD